MAELKAKLNGNSGGGHGGGPGGPGGRGGFQKPKNARKTLSRLLGYITGKKWPLLIVAVCVIISAVATIASTYLIRPVLNELISSSSLDAKLASLARTLLTMGVIFLLGAICSYVQSAIMVQLANRGTNRLRAQLFDALESLPLSYFDAHSHGELMSRFTNDADYVQQMLEQSIVSLFSSALTFIGVVAMMLYTCAPLFLITVALLIVLFLSFRVIGGRNRKLYQAQQKALGDMNGEIQETIEGLRVVKAFTHEEQTKARFAALNDAYYDVAKDANFYSTAIMPLAGNLMNIGYAVTAVIGGALAFGGGLDLGGLAIYLQYGRQVGQPMNQVSQQISAILSALAGAERIFEVIDTPPEIDEGKVTLTAARKNCGGSLSECQGGESHTGHWAWKVPQANGGTALVEVRGAVKLTDVCFSYVPGKPVLKHVSVYANPGQKIAFVGSTGAGKTTVTSLINRFYEIDSGSITYDGIDIREIRKDDLRRSMGAVLQDTHLFTGTVMENIRYGRLSATDEECIAAAKSANAHSFIRRLPNGYDTRITGDGANLSQGQRQLLSIARAAVADPPVMVLDEATSSIDTRTERHIEKGMDALMEDRTVFVIAHRLSTVRNSNCIVVIEDGQIQEKGDHGELLAEKGRYYMLYTGQNILE